MFPDRYLSGTLCFSFQEVFRLLVSTGRILPFLLELHFLDCCWVPIAPLYPFSVWRDTVLNFAARVVMLLFPLLAAAAASAAAQLYPDPVGPLTPWQIHLAYGEDGAYSSMSVTWSTRQLPPGDPVVKVGLVAVLLRVPFRFIAYPLFRSPQLTAVASGTTQMFTGESTYFVASYGDEQWFHRVRRGTRVAALW
jgi:hypothetical protein